MGCEIVAGKQDARISHSSHSSYPSLLLSSGVEVWEHTVQMAGPSNGRHAPSQAESQADETDDYLNCQKSYLPVGKYKVVLGRPHLPRQCPEGRT